MNGLGQIILRLHTSPASDPHSRTNNYVANHHTDRIAPGAMSHKAQGSKQVSCAVPTLLIVKERLSAISANHPVIHTPPAATSWASCLFAVSVGYIVYLLGTLSSVKKPAEAGLTILYYGLFLYLLGFPEKITVPMIEQLPFILTYGSGQLGFNAFKNR